MRIRLRASSLIVFATLLVRSGYCIEDIVELTPDKPEFVTVWTESRENGSIDIAVAVKKDHPRFRSAAITMVLLEKRDDNNLQLQTEIGTSLHTRDTAYSIAFKATPAGSQSTALQELGKSPDIDFYFLTLSRSLLKGAVLRFQPAQQNIRGLKFWLNLERFSQNRIKKEK